MFMQNAIIWTVNLEIFITRIVVVRSRGVTGWILQLGIAKFNSLNFVKLVSGFIPISYMSKAHSFVRNLLSFSHQIYFAGIRYIP